VNALLAPFLEFLAAVTLLTVGVRLIVTILSVVDGTDRDGEL